MRAEDTKFYGHFFEGDKRQYIIPVYQRNYDWSLEECKKLFDDIVFAFESDKQHYIGSIIQVQKDEEHGIKPFIVIDGQQRLTTIYLLLTALLELEKNSERVDVLRESVFNKFTSDTPKDATHKYKLKLKANTNDNVQLIKLMSGKLNGVDKTSNIYINYEYFKKLIETSGHSTHDIKKGLEKLICVVISLNESKGDDPQVIFERINSTGLPLELDDLVRNYVLMTADNQDELFVEYWSKIEDSIPKQSRPSFIIDYLNAYTSYQVNVKNSYEVFKKWAKENYDNREEVLKTLTRFSKYYSAFITESPFYSREINEKLEGLRRLDQGTVYTFLFYIFDNFENGIINEETLLKILEDIESYSIRRLVCERQSNSLRGLYKNLYNRIFDKIDKPYDFYDVFASFMSTQLIGTKDEFPDDSRFKQYLISTKLYRNKKLTKYFLGVLENYNSKEKIDVTSDSISIEHILPQNFENTDWRKDLGEEYESVYNTYLDTLGNITLTGYNSNLSDNSFIKKQEILKNTKTKISYLNKEFVGSDKWNEETILSRAERLAEDAISIFKFPEHKGVLYHQKTTANQFEVGLDNVEAAEGANPVFIELFGERREVKSYREVLKSVINTLYLLDEKSIRTLAIEKFRPMNSDRIYLTTDKEDIRYRDQINNTGIFYTINLSSIYALEFIKQLFYKLGIELDELVVYCKLRQ